MRDHKIKKKDLHQAAALPMLPFEPDHAPQKRETEESPPRKATAMHPKADPDGGRDQQMRLISDKRSPSPTTDKSEELRRKPEQRSGRTAATPGQPEIPQLIDQQTSITKVPKKADPGGIGDLYREWFLDYASYVVLYRAIPAIEDGLKPVQRLLLHAMHILEDGRYNKVSNITGQTMQYHPHGDAAITDALVQLGQKKLLIDTQGNWGDPRTGDSAAAGRYIEARLTHFAKEVVYSAVATSWEASYDNRKKQPKKLPIKFPILLCQGVEGIAVGLSTRILPHNFNEIADSCIAYLQRKPFQLYPDFPSGGYADCSNYQGGMPGGRVRLRAKIEARTAHELEITALPYGQTTSSLIESILKAHDAGHFRCKQVVDRTASKVSIQIKLFPGQDAKQVVEALYGFTNCQTILATQSCVIIDGRPQYLPVEQILMRQVEETMGWFKQELIYEIELLRHKIIQQKLTAYFIAHKVYLALERCNSWQEVIDTLKKALNPYLNQLQGEPITEEQILKLTELKIRQITRYDLDKNEQKRLQWEEELNTKKENLNNLVAYTIGHYQQLKKKYGGSAKARQTQLTTFAQIVRKQLIPQNLDLYAAYKTGFIGYQKDQSGTYIGKCNQLDKLVLIFKDGRVKLVKVAEKQFVGEGLLDVTIFNTKEERLVYHLIYTDHKKQETRVKRFQLKSLRLNKSYPLFPQDPAREVHYLSKHFNGESEQIQIQLDKRSKARKKQIDFDFHTLQIKGKSAQGNILTRYPIAKIVPKSVGATTLGSYPLWYNPATEKLHTTAPAHHHKQYLGRLMPQDLLLLLLKDGSYAVQTVNLEQPIDPTKIALLHPLHIQSNRDAIPLTLLYRVGGDKAGVYAKQMKFDPLPGKRGRFLPKTAQVEQLLILSTPHHPLDPDKNDQSVQVTEPAKRSTEPAKRSLRAPHQGSSTTPDLLVHGLKQLDQSEIDALANPLPIQTGAALGTPIDHGDRFFD